MRPISRETMISSRINIEEIRGRNLVEKTTSDRISSHAIFLFDGLDKKRKKKIEKLIDYFSEDGLKISKMGCSSIGNFTESEIKEIIFEALRNKIKSGEIGSDTIIFMNFHTYSGDDSLSFSIKGIEQNIRIPVEEIYQCVWSQFPEHKKPSFHNMGCNTGYFAKELKNVDGQVINYAGESTIGQKEGISLAKEVLRFVSISTKFNGSMPSAEKIWQHMENYATQEMSITGKGSLMFHKPMTLPASTINGYFNPLKGHKNPKLLIEYAFRHRPMEQVQKLIEIHDPKYQQLKNMGESAKARLLFHIVPNRVAWTNFNQHTNNLIFFEKWLEHHDSLQKFLFLEENNLFPKSIDTEQANRILLATCKDGNAKLARHILEMPEFPVSDSGKQSALMESIKSGSVELTEILMEHAPDFYIEDQDLNTVFHLASSQPTSAIIEALLKPVFLAKFTGNSKTERKKTREELLNQKNKNGLCPLELAIKKNNPEIVKKLLDVGARPKGLNSKGNSFLHQAVHRGNATVVKLLLACGPEIFEEENNFPLLLRKAIIKLNRDVAMILVAFCAETGKILEINTPDDAGITPLMLAAKKNDTKLIFALLDAGADPAVRCNSGKNVLHKISKEIHIDDENSIKIEPKFFDTSSEKILNQEINFLQTENIIRKFIARGASVNDVDKSGNTPALLAASEKNNQLVRLFVLHGADINAKNNDGYTLLHYALQNKDKNLSSFLIENGATLDAEDSAI